MLLASGFAGQFQRVDVHVHVATASFEDSFNT